MTWQAVCEQKFALGESPFWHPREQTLYWVDISACQLVRANVYMGTVQTWDMPGEPGCIAPARNGGLVVALRHGVFRVREWAGALELLATLPYDSDTVRANDGKCDVLGRFWVGTVDETKTKRAAALYSIDCRGAAPVVQCHTRDALTANGLAWSPDNRTLYWADTPAHIVSAWDFDVDTAAMSQRRAWLNMAPKPSNWQPGHDGYSGRPDGAAVDVQGNYFVAMYEGACISKFAPDGTLLAQHPVPFACPTMPCFGGEDGKTLFVTSARRGRPAHELAHYPLSGGVLFMRVDVPGLPVNEFVD